MVKKVVKPVAVAKVVAKELPAIVNVKNKGGESFKVTRDYYEMNKHGLTLNE